MAQTDRPLRSGFLRVPRRVWLDGDRLCWTNFTDDGLFKPTHKRQRPDMFPDFIALAGKDDAAFERYASRWGVFQLCKHDVPHLHNTPAYDGQQACQPRGSGKLRWEPLKQWRGVVAKFRACLSLAADFQAGSKGSKEAWAVLGLDYVPQARSKRLTWLRVEVNNALYLGRAMPALEIQNDSFVTVYQAAGGNLYGELALQLLLHISQTDGLANCAACGRPFAPSDRRPKSNQRAYCPQCRRAGAPVRDAMRDYRAREKEKASG